METEQVKPNGSARTLEEPFYASKMGFRTSREIDQIAAALVLAQSKFGAAIKDAANPAYRSKYADLSAVIEATQKPLNDNGIAVLQAPQLDGQMVTVTTRLQHKSGQWYESDLTLPAVQRDRFDAQSVGSAITYARRYSLQAITGLATEDDDGNAASGVGSKGAAQQVGQQKAADLEGKLQESIKQANEKKGEPAKPPVLFTLLTYDGAGDEQFEVTGDVDVLNAHKNLLLLHGKKKDAKTVLMTGEGLNTFAFEFEKRGGKLKPLKPAT